MMILKASSNCTGLSLSKSKWTKPLYMSKNGICLFSLKTPDGVKAGSCFFRLAASSVWPCRSKSLIASISALYFPEAMSLPISSNALFSTGIVKFLNIVLVAMFAFWNCWGIVLPGALCGNGIFPCVLVNFTSGQLLIALEPVVQFFPFEIQLFTLGTEMGDLFWTG